MKFKSSLTTPFFMALTVLAGCSGVGTSLLPGPGFLNTGTLVGKAKGGPIEVYRLIAGRVRNCWLDPAAPLLGQQVFFARSSRKKAESAQIILYQKTKDGRRGLKTYEIGFQADDDNTAVFALNYKIQPQYAVQLTSDLSRWLNGAQSCAGTENAG